MKNFTIILFIFFILFLIFSLFVSDLLWIFLTIFFALIISFLCLNKYLGFPRAMILFILLIILPFILEYFLFIFNVPFFNQTIIEKLTFNQLDIPINLSNLFYVFSVPLLFITSFIFAKKIKNFIKIKNYHKTSLVIISSILLALTFISFKNGIIDFQLLIKWFILAMAVYTIGIYLYKFNPDIPEIYKELPIILYLSIYGTNALKLMNSINLLITLFLIIFYLYILYKEYKIRQLAAAS